MKLERVVVLFLLEGIITAIFCTIVRGIKRLFGDIIHPSHHPPLYRCMTAAS